MEFKFMYAVNQEVITPFGDKGIIDTCAVNNSGEATYYVLRDHMSQWFKEEQLKEAE